MARFNELLVGRYNRLCQKLFSMKGSANLVTLSDELFAVLPLFYGAENRYLEGWERFGLISSAGPTASNQSAARMRNPVGSNMVAVFEKIAFQVGAATQIAMHFGPITVDLATVGGAATSRFDPRGRTSNTIIQSFQSSAVSAPTPPNEMLATGANAANIVTDCIVTDVQELQLLPGDALQLTTVNANVQLIASFWWRERFLEDSERA